MLKLNKTLTTMNLGGVRGRQGRGKGWGVEWRCGDGVGCREGWRGGGRVKSGVGDGKGVRRTEEEGQQLLWEGHGLGGEPCGRR